METTKEYVITIRMMFEYGADPVKPWKPKRSQVGKAFKVPEDTGKHKKVRFLKAEFLSYLLMETGEMESLYQSFPEFIMAVRAWSRIRQPYWQRIFDVMAQEYNPLENYDRYARIRDFDKSHQKHGDLTTGTQTTDFTEGVIGAATQHDTTTEHNVKETIRDTDFESHETVDDTLDGEQHTTEKRTEDIDIAGYDSGNLVDRQLTSVDGQVDTTSHQEEEKKDQFNSTEHMEQNETEDKLKVFDSQLDTTQDTDSQENVKTRENQDGFEDKRTSHVMYDHTHGNIGVRSSQELFEQELEVARYSMYDIILQEFKEQFCLEVY